MIKRQDRLILRTEEATATTRRATRYPVLPRKAKPKAGYSQQLAEEAAKVYAEIVDPESVRQLRWPGWKNAENVIEMGLASLAEVAKQRDDPETAMRAGLWLVEYGNRQLEKSGRSADGAAIMNQLEALYKRALPGAEGEPLVVNVDQSRTGAYRTITKESIADQLMSETV